MQLWPVSRLLLLAIVLCGVVRPAAAQAPSEGEISSYDFSGMTVTELRFSGLARLAEDEVRYLVEQEEGARFDLQAVRRSTELLFRLGQFDDVQARLQEVEGGLRLTFVLVPSARIAAIRLSGAGRLPPAEVRAALSRSAGDPYVQQDELRLAREVAEFYRQRGFLDVSVEGSVLAARGGGRTVLLSVDQGPAYKVSDIRFPAVEIAGFGERRLLKMLAPHLREGRVFREQDLEDGVRRLLDRYREAGFVEARLLHLGPRGGRRLPVDVRVDRENAGVIIYLPIDAGPFVQSKFRFAGYRHPAWSDRRLRDVVGLTGSQRVSATYAEDAGALLERFLRRRGYSDARVLVAIEDLPLPAPAPGDWQAARVSTKRSIDFQVTVGRRQLLRHRDFDIRGNSFLSRQEVIRVLSDASPEVLGHRPALSVILGLPIYQRYYTEPELAAALAVLRDYYRARGFLDLQLRHAVSRLAEAGRGPAAGRRAGYRIRLDIVEGIRTRVEGLVFAAELPLENRQLASWRRRFEGKPFNPAAQERLRVEVVGALGELGFLDAEVELKEEFSDDRSLVRLVVDAELGDRVRFGKVLVAETRHTQVGVIRGQVPLRAGELFRPSALVAAERRLLRTGLFDSVSLGPAQRVGKLRDIEVLSVERSRFSFLFGAGLTAPDDGPRLSGEARLRNLDGRGLTLWLRGRASIDWRYLGQDFAPRFEYRASVGLELPYIPGLPFGGTLSAVLGEELDEPTYRLSRSLAAVTLAWRGSEDFTLDGRLEIQARAPLRVDPAAQLSRLADIPTDQPLAGARPLVLLGLKASVDKRDDRFNPSKGIFASAAFDSTPGDLVPESAAFGRLAGRFVGLLPMGDKGLVLQLELGGGIIWSYNDSIPPVEWRFRLGGASTVRGFRHESLGPAGSRPGLLESEGLLAEESGARLVPVGGTAFYRYSLQVLMPLPGLNSWRFVLFHDAGNSLFYRDVPAGVDSSLNPALHPSFGIGLRRITPIGPLRLDLGFAVANAKYLPNISIGDFVQFHFAVGSL